MHEDLEHVTDEGLFPLMSKRRAHDGNIARLAFEELYRRNAGYLYRSFRWVAPAVYYGEDDLLQDTFLRAFEKAGNYLPSGLGFDAARRRVRAWLATIADRLIKERWPRDRTGFVRLTQLTRECWDAITEQPRPPNTTPAQVHEALQQLKSRDREIILLYMHWYDPELEKQRVPEDVLAGICAHYDVTRENFRQIVSRTLKRLEKALGKE